MTKNNQSKKKSNRTWIRPVLIITAIIVVAGIILIQKNNAASVPGGKNELPEIQFDEALTRKDPIFVFFHSNNCLPCMEMMKLVDQVFPEFKDSITLVDVNVYDEKNLSLLQRFGIQTIPTQAFINRTGGGKKAVGVLSASQLRELLMWVKGT